jgi:hypothetical protein
VSAAGVSPAKAGIAAGVIAAEAGIAGLWGLAWPPAVPAFAGTTAWATAVPAFAGTTEIAA